MAGNGWAKLGAALAGVSDADRADIRAKTINALAATDYNVERAKGAIMKQRELERLGDTFGGMDIANAPDVANAVRAGVNLNQVYGGLEKQQKMGFRQQAVDAPDWDTANRAALGFGSGPVKLANVQGNTLINNAYQTGGGGVSATPLGESMIAENAAQAALANTRGQAALITANRPRAGGGSAAPKLDPVSKREFESADKLLNEREKALRAQTVGASTSPAAVARRQAIDAELQAIQADRQALYGKFRSQLAGDGLGNTFADAAGSELGVIEAEIGRPLTQAEKSQIAAGTFELTVPAPGAATPAVEARPGGYDFAAELPAKALDAVRSAGGAPVTFKNGSTWIFRDGQPIRVK